MDSLVDGLFSFKDACEDSFLVLPHLLSGFFFFVGLFTTNIGMLVLALGHLLVVPALSFYANSDTPFYDTTGIAWLTVLSSLAYGVVLVFTLAGCFGGTFGGFMGALTAGTVGGTFLLGLLALKFLSDSKFIDFGSMSPFDVANPYRWFAGPPPTSNPSELCYLSPGESTTSGRRTPSAWMIHVLFFFGVVIANAYSIYVLPSPRLNPTGDPTVDASSQEQLNQRVNTRKLITASIIGISLAALALLIYIRATFTPCDSLLAHSVLPMMITFLFGIAWFCVLTNSCGIPASDILGLVQGFISPAAIDNPIVCVGSANPLRSPSSTRP